MRTELEILMSKQHDMFVAIIGVIIAFLSPIIPLLLLVGGAIALDTITGVWKAKRLNEKITSKKLSRIISKMLLYQLAIILFFVMDKYIIGDFVGMFTHIPLVLTKLMSLTFSYIELKSIDENYEAMTGKSFWKSLKEMLHRAKAIKKDIED
jgi:hypothetical protein